ncbi:hypothetical protein [Streptomyces sp. NBC_00847]|uniref:hypothetical protein n=1 Tax=unclassified Streptomyces TaxID=2593676 RepID=UPI00224D5F2D|nr:hypothetical protein [Streptomyces sp. NBC_00847]MCX4884395.1 hypothetical protein [Streptomyces sp. NBC_00847]
MQPRSLRAPGRHGPLLREHPRRELFVLGRAPAGPAAVLAHPAYALAAAALLAAICGTGSASHPTTGATRPGHPARNTHADGQARAVAVTGSLAESCGPAAAFVAARLAAVPACVMAGDGAPGLVPRACRNGPPRARGGPFRPIAPAWSGPGWV